MAHNAPGIFSSQWKSLADIQLKLRDWKLANVFWWITRPLLLRMLVAFLQKGKTNVENLNTVILF